MEYVKTRFLVDKKEVQEILVASLSAEGYEGFEETDEYLDAYIGADKYNQETVQQIADSYGIKPETEHIGEQNWNEEWEKNFQPVIVDGFCTIRADFHNIAVNTPYEIVITPKMSFGTGHHATTKLVMMQMAEMDMKDKTVFDFGTGTGILAILAEKLGAADVYAVDNDEWSYENTRENIERNNCAKVKVALGTIDAAKGRSFDVILANINRHILLQYMQEIHDLLKPGGHVLLSGILTEDIAIILESAVGAGFVKQKEEVLNNWVVLKLQKP